MTIKTFLEEPYQTEMKSIIVEISKGERPYIVLDRTIFYATSGGQPGDIGFFTDGNALEIKVIETKYAPDRNTILHFVEEGNDFHGCEVGSEISIEIDWTRRHRLMRMHTAMHLLCSLIPYPVTGGGVGEFESRVEFDMQTSDFDKIELSKKLTDLSEQSLEVEVSWISEEELDKNPELVRTMSVQPPRGMGRVRMLNIGNGVDFQPCGGTHVKNTSEIGPMAVTKIKSKGKQNKRVSIALLNP